MTRAAVMLETNFTGLVTTLLAFGPQMKARGSGTIVGRFLSKPFGSRSDGWWSELFVP